MRVGHRQAFIQKPSANMALGFFFNAIGVLSFAFRLRCRRRPSGPFGAASRPLDLICVYTHTQAGHRQAFIQNPVSIGHGVFLFYGASAWPRLHSPFAAHVRKRLRFALALNAQMGAI